MIETVVVIVSVVVHVNVVRQRTTWSEAE